MMRRTIVDDAQMDVTNNDNVLPDDNAQGEDNFRETLNLELEEEDEEEARAEAPEREDPTGVRGEGVEGKGGVLCC